jgi:hypothetical protein
MKKSETFQGTEGETSAVDIIKYRALGGASGRLIHAECTPDCRFGNRAYYDVER